MNLFTNALRELFRANPGKTIEISESDTWCDEHKGTKYWNIRVNGDKAGEVCPLSDYVTGRH